MKSGVQRAAWRSRFGLSLWLRLFSDLDPVHTSHYTVFKRKRYCFVPDTATVHTTTPKTIKTENTVFLVWTVKRLRYLKTMTSPHQLQDHSTVSIQDGGQTLSSGFLGQWSQWFLRPVSTSANSAARPSDGLSGHAQLEIQAESERLLANARSVLKLNQAQLFRDQKKPIKLLLFNARACDRTWSENRPLVLLKEAFLNRVKILLRVETSFWFSKKGTLTRYYIWLLSLQTSEWNDDKRTQSKSAKTNWLEGSGQDQDKLQRGGTTLIFVARKLIEEEYRMKGEYNRI